MNPPPTLIAVGPMVELVPRGEKGHGTLRRTQLGIKPGGIKVAAVRAGMIEHPVKHHAHAALGGLGAKTAKILLRAQHGVDGQIIGGIIAVIAGGFKNRVQVKGGDGKTLQIVQLADNALQVTAEKVAVGDLPVGFRTVKRLVRPVFVHQPVTHHAGGVGQAAAAKAIWKYLVSHAGAEPGRCHALTVIDGELPALQLGFVAVTVTAEADAGAVPTGEAEAVPEQVGL